MRQALLEIIKDEARVITEQIEKQYLSDNLGRKSGRAAALVKVLSTKEVSSVLQYAYQHEIPVTPRGAGTNLVGSTVPADGGIVIDLTGMNHIIEIDKTNFTATVEAGVLLQDFQKIVESEGLFYPPDPGEKKATLGGNISTNAGGMRAVKYGVTRDYVLGLEAVLADGRILELGSKNRKDTTGLDIKDLVIGAEGTLAVITKAILKLLPKPEDSLSVLIGYDSLKSGIEGVREIIEAKLSPTAIEFMESNVVHLGEEFLHESLPGEKAEAYILLTFDGKRSEIRAYVKDLEEVTKETARSFVVLDKEKDKTITWKIRGELVHAVEAVSEQEPLDIVVPISQIDVFVKAVAAIEKQYGMRMIAFGHAGDGNVHLCVVRGDRDEVTWEKELQENLKRLYQKTYELGGLISGEHGIGISKRLFFFSETDKNKVVLMNRIKRAFDNKLILNRNISYVWENLNETIK